MEGKLPNSLYEASITLIPKPKTPLKKRTIDLFPDEHGCKSPQQDISQLGPAIHLKNYSPGRLGGAVG